MGVIELRLYLQKKPQANFKCYYTTDFKCYYTTETKFAKLTHGLLFFPLQIGGILIRESPLPPWYVTFHPVSKFLEGIWGKLSAFIIHTAQADIVIYQINKTAKVFN